MDSQRIIRKRIVGLLLGGSVGDALGLPAEGLPPARQRKWWPGDLRHRFAFGRGMISDDREHAFMTAQALLEADGDVERFRRALAWKLRWWFLALPAGVGLATARACFRLWLGVSPERSGVNSAGNGPAMRSAKDNDERIGAFERAVASLGGRLVLRVWRDVPTMIAEVQDWLPRAALISLDHDLVPQPGGKADPGDGLQAATFLAELPPACPVIIHSSNADRTWSMHNELRFASWPVERVGPIGQDWIPTTWLAAVRGRMERFSNTWPARLPQDHDTRMERARLSLEGLGVGDALGEMLSYRAESASEKRKAMFDEVLRRTPESAVRRGILLASQVPPDVSAADAAKTLGNGSLVTAPDTVPFCLWIVARHSTDFVQAIGEAITVGGDCDTNAAIVGGIVALSAGRASIPDEWLRSREPVTIC